jgi:TRAP-type C4-dicarboxylate transport system permease small subunit
MKVLLLACLPVVFGLLLFFVFLYFWSRGRELRDRGVTTNATVVKKLETGSGLVRHHFLVVQFTDLHGNLHTVELKVRRSRGWVMVREGSTIPITYVPGNAEKAEMGVRWGKKLAGWVLMIFALFGAGMVVFGLVQIIGLLTGRLKPGEV